MARVRAAALRARIAGIILEPTSMLQRVRLGDDCPFA
jgi:hypothetical protein